MHFSVTELWSTPFSSTISGDSSSWVYETLKIPIVFTIEMSNTREIGNTVLASWANTEHNSEEVFADIEAVLDRLTMYSPRITYTSGLCGTGISIHDISSVMSIIVYLFYNYFYFYSSFI